MRRRPTARAVRHGEKESTVRGRLHPLRCQAAHFKKRNYYKSGSTKNPLRIMIQDADTNSKHHEIERDSQNVDNAKAHRNTQIQWVPGHGVSWSTTRCHGRGNSSLRTGDVIRRWIVRDGWQRSRKDPIWRTVMVEPEVSINGMKQADPHGARPNRTIDACSRFR